MQRFRDRNDAGERLARRLRADPQEATLVLALPRGGVPVAVPVARALGAPLDVLVVRKLGAPHQPELAIGAIAPDGVRVLNDAIVRALGLGPDEVERIAVREAEEVERRERLYRQGRPPPDPEGRTVVLVDDGIATGATTRAAVRWARSRRARRVVVAAPVIAAETAQALGREADEVVAVLVPDDLEAVGAWYVDFSQTSDGEVLEALRPKPRASASLPPGDLLVPLGARGIVLFAHGSGSGRKSPRNQFVAERLRRAGLGTLLFDLLTLEEEARDRVDGALRFDILFLARRLVQVTDAVGADPRARGLAVGLFGASTGAGAALVAAAERPDVVRAVVSRGGRPDLAGAEALARVRAPTLLVVGGEDREVLGLNRRAAAHLVCPHRIDVVPGAGHLFEEPGTLAAVADLAATWFAERLV